MGSKHIHEPIAWRAKQLCFMYTLLAQLMDGEAWSIVASVESNNEMEAWRR